MSILDILLGKEKTKETTKTVKKPMPYLGIISCDGCGRPLIRSNREPYNAIGLHKETSMMVCLDSNRRIMTDKYGFTMYARNEHMTWI